MADVFTEGQGKRFFGAVAAGGSLGGVVGSAAASLVLSPPASLPWLKVSPTGMLLIAALALLLSMVGLRGIHASPRREAVEAIYVASDPELERVPNFYATNAEALADMKALAEREAARG